VTDACGNVTEKYCDAKVVDKVAPVAICDDRLNISIGGPHTIGEGLARVTAADVDEDSWYNCGPVDLYVRREIDEACLAPAYAPLVNGLNWPGIDHFGRDAVEQPLQDDRGGCEQFAFDHDAGSDPVA
jgi:hypothetical protein